MQRKSNLVLSEYPAGFFSQHRIVNFSHSHLAWVYNFKKCITRYEIYVLLFENQDHKIYFITHFANLIENRLSLKNT